MAIRRVLVISGCLGAVCGGVGWIVFTRFLSAHPAGGFGSQSFLLWIGLFALLFSISRLVDEKFGLTAER